MQFLSCLFLGIVQGLTEFFPVSSSAHLALFQNLFRMDVGSSILFDVLLHVGTLFVIIWFYRRQIGKMILAFFGMIGDLFANGKIRRANKKAAEAGEDPRPLRCVTGTNYRRFVVLIIISTIPTGIIGFLGRKLVDDASRTLLVPGICLLVTGCILLLSRKAVNNTRIPQDIGWKEALIIGIAQGFATMPGLSRSGLTITICLLFGFDCGFAVMYSFILSVPAVLGATILELKDVSGEVLSGGSIAAYIAGMAAAAVVGFFCIRKVIEIVKKKKYYCFAYYCFAVGAVALIGSFFL